MRFLIRIGQENGLLAPRTPLGVPEGVPWSYCSIHLYASDDHFRNFIDCVISRGPTAAPVEVAHRSITICHLGNIAMRLGRDRLRWDPRTERIVGNPEASAMLGRPHRDPWKLPDT